MERCPGERWSVERQTLLEVTREMVGARLVAGSSGNASVRLSGDSEEGLILITPARRPYRELGAGDMVVVDLEGEPVEGDALPSTETASHLALYKARKDIGAIVHTHSVYASAAAVAGIEIPAIVDEMVMSVGGSVRVAEYGFPSTEELAERVCRALGDRNAVLLRNHGVLGVGSTAWEALDVCHLVERAAHIYVFASLLGKSVGLPPEIIKLEQELFKMRTHRGSTDSSA